MADVEALREDLERIKIEWVEERNVDGTLTDVGQLLEAIKAAEQGLYELREDVEDFQNAVNEDGSRTT